MRVDEVEHFASRLVVSDDEHSVHERATSVQAVLVSVDEKRPAWTRTSASTAPNAIAPFAMSTVGDLVHDEHRHRDHEPRSEHSSMTEDPGDSDAARVPAFGAT